MEIFRKVLPIILSILALLFTYRSVTNTDNAFNYIPFLIHESINPGGKSETIFIEIFDILFSILVGYFVYKVFRILFKK